MQLTCEKCQGVVTYEETDCGKEMSCPHCEAEIKIPAAPIKLPDVPEISRADIHAAAFGKIRGITQYGEIRSVGSKIETTLGVGQLLLLLACIPLFCVGVIAIASGSIANAITGVYSVGLAIVCVFLAWFVGLIGKSVAELFSLSADIGDLLMWQHVDRRMVQRQEIQKAEDALKRGAREKAQAAAWESLQKDAASVAKDTERIGGDMAKAIRKMAEEFGA